VASEKEESQESIVDIHVCIKRVSLYSRLPDT
jgi:hypothetical protein